MTMYIDAYSPARVNRQWAKTWLGLHVVCGDYTLIGSFKGESRSGIEGAVSAQYSRYSTFYLAQ